MTNQPDKSKAPAIAICKYNDGYTNLTPGKAYQIVRFTPGIFATCPYVVVIDNNGKETTAHKQRFEYKDKELTH